MQYNGVRCEIYDAFGGIYDVFSIQILLGSFQHYWNMNKGETM